MDITKLKALGLPYLEAHLFAHNRILYKIFTVARTTKLSASLVIAIENESGFSSIETFKFPTQDEIPPELQKFLNDYSTRLIAERWLIEEAIEELQSELQQPANMS